MSCKKILEIQRANFGKLTEEPSQAFESMEVGGYLSG